MRTRHISNGSGGQGPWRLTWWGDCPTVASSKAPRAKAEIPWRWCCRKGRWSQVWTWPCRTGGRYGEDMIDMGMGNRGNLYKFHEIHRHSIGITGWKMLKVENNWNILKHLRYHSRSQLSVGWAWISTWGAHFGFHSGDPDSIRAGLWKERHSSHLGTFQACFCCRHRMSLLVKGEALSKLSACSPGIVPPDCELIFEVHILEADGILCAKDQCDRLPPAAVPEIGPNDFHHPWWLARVESLGISWHILAYSTLVLCQVSQVQGIGETWQDNKLRKLVKTLENVHCCPLLFTAQPFWRLPSPPLYYLNFCAQTAKERTPVTWPLRFFGQFH